MAEKELYVEKTNFPTEQRTHVFRADRVLSGTVSFQFAVETPTLVAVLVQRGSSALAELAPAVLA